MKRYIIITLVMLLLAVAGVVEAAELIKVRLNEVVHSIFYVPQYVALSQGFFKAEGLDIELSTAWGGDKAATALLTGTADIALIGPETTIYIYKQGAANYLVNFAQLTNRAGSFLLARKPMPNFTWKNVKGKVIVANRPGGTPQMVLEWIIKNNGMNPYKDMKMITNLDFTANAGAFAGGLGDYVQLFEPQASLLEAQGRGYVVASLGAASGPLPYTCFIARKEYIAKNPVIIQKFTNAIYRAQKWTATHSVEEVAKAIEAYFPDTTPAILRSVIKRYIGDKAWSLDPLLRKEVFDHWQDIVIAAGELDKRLPYEVLVNTQFAKKAIETIK